MPLPASRASTTLRSECPHWHESSHMDTTASLLLANARAQRVSTLHASSTPSAANSREVLSPYRRDCFDDDRAAPHRGPLTPRTEALGNRANFAESDVLRAAAR